MSPTRSESNGEPMTSPENYAALAFDERCRSARSWTLRFLRVLAGKMNADLLATLLEATGHRLAYADVLSCGEWLAERGYIKLGDFEGLPIYTLTRLGDDAGRGVVTDPGLATISVGDAEDDDERRLELSR